MTNHENVTNYAVLKYVKYKPKIAAKIEENKHPTVFYPWKKTSYICIDKWKQNRSSFVIEVKCSLLFNDALFWSRVESDDALSRQQQWNPIIYLHRD